MRLRACCVLPVAGVHEPVAKNVDGRGCQSAKDTQPGEASALCKQQGPSQLQTRVWRIRSLSTTEQDSEVWQGPPDGMGTASGGSILKSCNLVIQRLQVPLQWLFWDPVKPQRNSRTVCPLQAPSSTGKSDTAADHLPFNIHSSLRGGTASEFTEC